MKNARAWIVVGALWAAVAVALGAFGAHSLEERLAAADQLESWRTAVGYQTWHALALVLFGVWRERTPGGFLAAWLFAVGSLCFSGSIYVLALEPSTSSWIWPVTPFGGLLLIAGWVAFGAAALKRA